MPYSGGGSTLPTSRVWAILDSGTVSSQTSFSTASFDGTTYDRVKIFFRLTSSAAAGSMNLRINNDSTASDYVYMGTVDGALNSASGAQMFIAKQGDYMVGEFEITSQGTTDGANAIFGSCAGRSTSSGCSWNGACIKKTGVDLTSIQIISDQATSLSGDYIVYGLATGL